MTMTAKVSLRVDQDTAEPSCVCGGQHAARQVPEGKALWDNDTLLASNNPCCHLLVDQGAAEPSWV